ncbi:MAG: SoxR reducing system RseC family protein [Bacteroidales bacterium]|jgi:sigma-E factor negative regulatory protein RseC|nr:SoxR reducing system RseC family protein [Bacteroidales bacterium]MDD4218156.1 SoxR reducing system RseC family protein [Bacteroidales bacterium]MDY0141401.1 SoxR reducing system RseC family protein [Bacteroidales bacterium]
MSRNSTIEHKGVVADVKSDAILVDLVVQSACAACHAKSVCGIDSSLKTIEVKTDKKTFNIGEKVKVVMRASLGMKALFLGYVLPFIVVVTTLLILISLNVSEGLSGLISILILAPYYLTLYFFNDKIKREFNFDIEKI